jgi:UDP-N-acetylglucosamine 4,6-dehydratase
MSSPHHGVLITGGTGFLAQGLVRHLLAAGEQRICILSRGEFAQAQMAARYAEHAERLHFFVGDVRDRDRLERAMHQVEVVIHAAALKRIEVGYYNPDEMIKTNVLGTMNVVEAARRARVRKLVLVSSDKAFEPVSPYGLSKALAEDVMLASRRMNLGMRVSVCRYGNVAGSTGSVIPTWRELLKHQDTVPVTDPECTRFWMSLAQAVALVASAIDGDEELTGLKPWEKKHESMAAGNCSADARRMTVDELRTELQGIQ